MLRAPRTAAAGRFPGTCRLKGFQMKVHFTTFGCKVNICDTASLSELMRSLGWETAETASEADVEIVNSCTVTANASRKVRTALRAAKKANPGVITVLCGCYPQAYPDEASAIPEADVVTGNTALSDIPSLIDERIAAGTSVRAVKPHQRGERYSLLPEGRDEEHTRAFIKIEDGCSRRCRYCVIPYARGKRRSMPLEEISARCRSAVGSGFREIVLTGINLSLAGRDLGFDLADAVEAAGNSGADRIRLGSIEPDILTDGELTRISKVKGVCPHFHMSLQSGCAKTLRAMGRLYTPEDYIKKAEFIRSIFENPVFTTDVIVGFPGETEQDFMESVSFVSEFGFLKVHVFPYSRRPGTPADSMSGQVSRAEKERRVHILSDAADKVRAEKLSSFTGTVETVLTERLRDGMWHGYTSRYAPAAVPDSPGIGRNMLVSSMVEKLEDGVLVMSGGIVSSD